MTEKIEKQIQQFKVKTNVARDKAVLESVLAVQRECEDSTAFVRTLKKVGIIAVAAGVVLIAAIWLRQTSEEDKTIAARSENTFEKITALSLNAAFYRGGMEAVEEQFEQAEAKASSGMQECITLNQCMSELDDYKDIQKRRGTL